MCAVPPMYTCTCYMPYLGPIGAATPLEPEAAPIDCPCLSVWAEKNCYRLRYWALKRGEQKYRTYRASEICFEYTLSSNGDGNGDDRNQTKTHNEKSKTGMNLCLCVWVCAYAKVKCVWTLSDCLILVDLFEFPTDRFCDFGARRLECLWTLCFHNGHRFCRSMQQNWKEMHRKMLVMAVANCDNDVKLQLCTLSFLATLFIHFLLRKIRCVPHFFSRGQNEN